MATVTFIWAIISAVLLMCELLCGLWIRKKTADENSKRFHVKLGIAATVSGLVTSVLAIIIVS